MKVRKKGGKETRGGFVIRMFPDSDSLSSKDYGQTRLTQ